jgi:putative endonuclease
MANVWVRESTPPSYGAASDGLPPQLSRDSDPPTVRQLGFEPVTAATGDSRSRTVEDVSSDPRHTLGEAGERLAAEHLQRLGYQILARNYRTRFGELDLVALDGGTLVFCEVKTRRGQSSDPWAALHAGKQARVRRMACEWLVSVRERPHSEDLRFDAIGVVIDAHGRLVRLDHLEGAFA